jgi:hypothetical protein
MVVLGSPDVTLHQLYAVCPRCFTPFVLKGSRLRKYNQTLERNPAMKGPYCSYLCSAPSNLEKAPTFVKKRKKDANRTE